MWASYHGCVKVVKAFIDAGADINYNDDFGNTGLSLAVQYTVSSVWPS